MNIDFDKSKLTIVSKGWLERLERFVLYKGRHPSDCAAYWGGPCSCGLTELQEDIITENAFDGFNREES